VHSCGFIKPLFQWLFMVLTVSLYSLIYWARCSKGSQGECSSQICYCPTFLVLILDFEISVSCLLTCHLFLHYWQNPEYYFYGAFKPKQTVFKIFLALHDRLTLHLKFMYNTWCSDVNSSMCNTKTILVSLIPHQHIFQTRHAFIRMDIWTHSTVETGA
jgi:hypothetical protein